MRGPIDLKHCVSLKTCILNYSCVFKCSRLNAADSNISQVQILNAAV